MGFFPDIYMARPSQVFSLNWLGQPIQNIFKIKNRIYDPTHLEFGGVL